MVRFVDVLAVCTIFLLTTVGTDRVHNKHVVCYVEYENDFKIGKVDLSLCTHLIAVDHVWGVKFETEEDPWTDSRDRSKQYKHLTKLRRKFPHLKISLALKHNFRDYLLIAKSNERNQTFIRMATDFVLQQKFDGLDLLWDFSRYQEYNYKYIFDEKYDQENFFNFMKEFKASFHSHNISLTTTFIAVNEKILENIDPFHLSNHFDFIHFLQWYIFDGLKFGQYQLALEMRSIRNMQKAIDCAIALGVPRAKIIMGLQLLPTVFDHFSSEVEKFDYGHVCDLEEKYDVTRGLGTAKKPVPILWTFLPEYERYIYETMRSVANKVRFAVRRDLGGIMVFPINYDDFEGKCTAKNNQFVDFKSMANITLNIPTVENTSFPLLRTINAAIIVATDEKVKEDQIQIENQTDKSRHGSFQDKIVMCYTLTRPDRKIITIPIENVNLNLCTHLVCIDNIWNTTADEEPWRDMTNASDYGRFTHLRQKYPHLKVIVNYSYLAQK
ncbi:probable chitinase 2 [Sitodiplosis mosellana]|uniref:probable chitinase 2 n=1 Tax=Sitodiplosis mosellana TaxID=263140 RepID=UPI0024445EB6|nr:probable chitinase 2 [Sitodiplosis mosellana]